MATTTRKSTTSTTLTATQKAALKALETMGFTLTPPAAKPKGSSSLRETPSGRWMKRQPNGSWRFCKAPKGAAETLKAKVTDTTTRKATPTKAKPAAKKTVKPATTRKVSPKEATSIRNKALASLMRKNGYGGSVTDIATWASVKAFVVEAVGEKWNEIPIRGRGKATRLSDAAENAAVFHLDTIA